MKKSNIKRTAWTTEETEQLKYLCKRKTNSEIAKIMNRSVSSIDSKRREIGATNVMYYMDYLTCKDVGVLVGQCSKTIYNLWSKNGFPYKKVGRFKVIREKNLVTFMQEHPELWKASQCDYEFFSKYDWFIERLRREREGIDEISPRRNRKLWTEYEESLAKMYWKKGLHYTEIGKKLNRSKFSAYHRVRKFEEEEWKTKK